MGTPSNEVLEELSLRITEKWRQLGRRLDIDEPQLMHLIEKITSVERRGTKCCCPGNKETVDPVPLTKSYTMLCAIILSN